MAMRNSATEMLDRMALGERGRSRLGPGYVTEDQDKKGRPSSPLSAYNAYVSSGFGRRTSPMGIGSKDHKGVDLSVGPGVGGYPAEAVGGGYVTHAGKMGGYGNLVEIEHPNGYRSRYGHLGKIGVKVGDWIARGTPIGLVGNTGRSTAPHLHFEVRDPMGKAVDPRSIVDFSARPAPTPSVRPMSPAESRNIASAYGDLARSMPAGMSNLAGRMAPGPSIRSLFTSIDPGRFAGMPDPSRFGGFAYSGPSAPMSPPGGYAKAKAAAMSQAMNDWSDIPEPARERFTQPPSIDQSRFGSFPSMASVDGPYSPSGPYARAEAPPTGPAMSMPTAERFGRPPAIDAARFSSLPAQPSIAGPYSPTGPYASVTGQVPTATASVSQGLAGNLMGLPAAPVSTVSVNPASMPTNMLSPTFTPPALDMTALNAFAPQTSPLMPTMPAPNAAVAMPSAMPAPNAPVALPPAPIMRQPLPPPVAIPPVSVPRSLPQSFPDAPPAPRSFSPADIYGGQVGQATASDGSTVGRDPFGRTTVTNQYGVTTAMTPDGKQAAYGGIPGPAGGSSLFGGAQMSPKAGGILGGLLGAAAGSMIGGPAGGLLGGLIGKSMFGGPQTGGGLLGGLFGGNRDSFPSAPAPYSGPADSRFSGVPGGSGRSLSPQAERAIASGTGGLY